MVNERVFLLSDYAEGSLNPARDRVSREVASKESNGRETLRAKAAVRLANIRGFRFIEWSRCAFQGLSDDVGGSNFGPEETSRQLGDI